MCQEEECPGATCTRTESEWVQVVGRKEGRMATRRGEGQGQRDGGALRSILRPSRT